jgi:hypothetical protein
VTQHTSADQPDDVELLMTCGDSAEAALIRSLLEAGGIECVVQGEAHRSMMGMLGSMVELRILVANADLEHARALLAAEAQPEPLPTESTPDDGSPRCARHQRKSTATCERCGTFLCDGCGEGCPSCEENDHALVDVPRRSKRKLFALIAMALLLLGGGYAVLSGI